MILALGLVFILILAGLVVWYLAKMRPPYGSLPSSPVQAQHVYLSDNGDTVLLAPNQRLIFDIGDMRAWGEPVISTTENRMIQLSDTTFASPDDGGEGTISFRRKSCMPGHRSCVLTIYYYGSPDNSGPSSLPGDVRLIQHQ